MSDITEKLLAMYDHRGDGMPTQYVNADGPEAVEAILALRKEVEALRGAFPADARAVMGVMSDEMAYPAAYLAADASEESGLSITPARVSAIRKALHTFGLAAFGSLFDDDSAYVKGRGYWLTKEGVNARAALATEAER